MLNRWKIIVDISPDPPQNIFNIIQRKTIQYQSHNKTRSNGINYGASESHEYKQKCVIVIFPFVPLTMILVMCKLDLLL